MREARVANVRAAIIGPYTRAKLSHKFTYFNVFPDKRIVDEDSYHPCHRQKVLSSLEGIHELLARANITFEEDRLTAPLTRSQ